MYYDCDEETERYLDEGKEIPLFCDWFMERSEFVDLSHTPFYTGAFGEMDSNPLEEAAVEAGDVEKSPTFGKEHVEWGRYKGRPIVWILDNEYAKGGGEMAIEVPISERTKETIALFPFFLDEAKSVYITENPNASVAYHYPLMQRMWLPYSSTRISLLVGGWRKAFAAHTSKVTTCLPRSRCRIIP